MAVVSYVKPFADPNKWNKPLKNTFKLQKEMKLI